MGLKKSDAAALLGRSRAAITQACKRGALPVLPDGTIDDTHPAWIAYAANASPDGFASKTRQRRVLSLPPVVVQDDMSPDPDPQPPADPQPDVQPAPPKRPARQRKTSDYLPDLSTMSSEELARKKQEADVIASLAKSKKAELDLSERRGELVDRATLAAAVFGYLGKLNRILLESVESEIELYFDRSESMTKQDLVKIRKELLTKHLTESATAIKSELRRGIIQAHKMAAEDDD